jgi:hypothetical protein
MTNFMNIINIEAINVFYQDVLKLSEIDFENSEYEIKSTCLILRKYLIDNVNINNIWKELGNEGKIYLTNVVPSQDLLIDDKVATKVYIPFLNVIPNYVINNYLAINANHVIKDQVGHIPFLPKLLLSKSKIGNYMKSKMVIDGQDFTREDIVEFIGYEQGYIHLTIDKSKVEKIKSIGNLRFENALKDNSAFIFTACIVDNNDIENSNIIGLGGKHHFETLIILQIIKDFIMSQDIFKLFNDSIEFLKLKKVDFVQIKRQDKTFTYNTFGLEIGENWV